MTPTVIVWTSFLLLIGGLLALDLGIFHRKAHVVSIREALYWSVVWVAVGVAFSAVVYVAYEWHWLELGTAVDPIDGRVNTGKTAAEKYLTGYLLEQSLSVDNLFIIATIFASFAVPALYQHRLLFWGIIGALFMRGTMIGIGAQLVASFHWILYVFGGFLVLTAIKMLTSGEAKVDPSLNIAVRLARRVFPVTVRYHGNHFFVVAGNANSKEGEIPGVAPIDDAAVARAKPGTWMLTPLAIALIVVETTDLIFAVDSIPAVFSVTADPFIVFTSNIFAILGLRSLFFLLAGMLGHFRFLKYALATVLLIIGAKMFFSEWLVGAIGPHFNAILLGVVFVILTAGCTISWIVDQRLISKR